MAEGTGHLLGPKRSMRRYLTTSRQWALSQTRPASRCPVGEWPRKGRGHRAVCVANPLSPTLRPESVDYQECVAIASQPRVITTESSARTGLRAQVSSRHPSLGRLRPPALQSRFSCRAPCDEARR